MENPCGLSCGCCLLRVMLSDALAQGIVSTFVLSAVRQLSVKVSGAMLAINGVIPSAPGSVMRNIKDWEILQMTGFVQLVASPVLQVPCLNLQKRNLGVVHLNPPLPLTIN